MKHVLLLTCLLSFFRCLAQGDVNILHKANVACFEKANEFKLAISFKPQNTQQILPNFSPSLEAAYAPIDHLVLLGSFHLIYNRQVLEEGWVLPEESAKVNGYAYEAGVGYFTSFGESGLAEVSLIYSNSSMSRRATDQSYSYTYGLNFDARYYGLTIQPSVGFNNELIILHGGIRYMLRDYYDMRWFDRTLADPNSLAQNTIGLFLNFETAGNAIIRFNMQGGISSNIQMDNESNGTSGYCTLGLALRLAPKERSYMFR